MSDLLPSVLVLGGGPDDERAVSLQSAAGVAAALRSTGATVHEATIDRPTIAELRAMPGDVVFPVLHGAFGEGGPLQDLLDELGRPYVGCGPSAARVAMDKIATKLHGAALGIATKPACVLNIRDGECPLPLPVVVKPVHDGSSVGLHLCRDRAGWDAAHRAASADIASRPGRAYMIEPLVEGRELTVGVLERGQGLAALPLIEIVAASGVYDYAAKYERDDTRYSIRPRLPAGAAERCERAAVTLARAIGVRHLCRVDFLLDRAGEPWLLEINTMPGFTAHSLVPMGAAGAGMEMPALCAHLVRAAAGRLANV
ncbi:MAG TPA: D-alanine--D-alanine ligase [Phycisphaerales bacterium]|nr:D-alanine--D-alanine ligase [Phycisphaerales bacterium]